MGYAFQISPSVHSPGVQNNPSVHWFACLDSAGAEGIQRR